MLLICFCLLLGCAADLLPQAHAESAQTASESCIAFIKEVEGFSPQPYYDYSQYTVGYGTECPEEKYSEYMDNGISRTEADRLLREYIADIEDAINEKLIEAYDLTLAQHEFDALVSFSYNIGIGWMTYNSTLRNAVLQDASDNDLVYAFGLYCTAGGKYLPSLITRRLCEANMFLNGVYSQSVNNSYGYVYYDANGGTLTYRVQGFICDDKASPAADAVREEDSFLGWYTDLTGGSRVTVLNRTLSGKTLFARWQSSETAGDQNTSSVTIKVTGDVVNIRSGPGTNYPVVKQVYKNTALTLSHITSLTNMKWGNVGSGWICLDFTNYDAIVNGNSSTGSESSRPSQDPEEPSPELPWNDSEPDTQKTVTGIVSVNDFLKIRSGPGKEHATVGFLFKGNRVEILEQKTVGTQVWGRIKDGWVCMDYIVTEADGTADSKPTQNENTATGSSGKGEAVSLKGTIKADALRIRSGAGTANSIVGFYYQNDKVVITEKKLVGSVYWGKTNKGWISMDYVVTDGSGTESAKPSAGTTMTVTADCLRIRKGAGTDYKIAALLYFGDTVVVYETKNVNGTSWGRVDQGWICMNYVK